MSFLVDSYDSQSTFRACSNGVTQGYAQSFTGAAGKIVLVRFKLAKTGTLSGNATAKLYAHTGTFGSTSKPTGTALATSDNFAVNTELSGTMTLEDFNFTGANQYVMTVGVKYCIAFEYSGGDGSNYVHFGIHDSSPSHTGNLASSFDLSGWNELNPSTEDGTFEVWADEVGGGSSGRVYNKYFPVRRVWGRR